MDIPRIIWQTWKTRDIPEQWQVGHDSVRTLNPGWRHVLMTDEDNRAFVEKHFPGFLNIYDAFPYPIQRADAIRYMLLYVHGGIYLDLDYEALRPFDDLALDRPVGLVKSGNLGSFATNSLMVAAQRHHPFWLECIAEMRRPPPLWAVSKHLVVMATTGPLMVHRVAKRRAGYVRFLDMQLPCNVCDLESHCRTKPVGRYYLRPIPGGSWNAWDSKALNTLFCNAWVIAAVLIVVLGAVLLAVNAGA